MRKLLIILSILLIPTLALAQNHVRVQKDNTPTQVTTTSPVEKNLVIPERRPLYFFSDHGLTYGARLLSEEKYASALQSFQRVLDVNPRNIDALTGIGAVYLGMDQTKPAGDYIRKALARDNKHIGANYLYGRYYIAIDRIDLALDQLTVLNMLCGTKYKCSEALALEGDLHTAQKK